MKQLLDKTMLDTKSNKMMKFYFAIQQHRLLDSATSEETGEVDVCTDMQNHNPDKWRKVM